MVDGKPMLAAYPNWEMNLIGDPTALQSVLGWEIDEINRAWFLDQGHIEGKPCIDGAQKLVCWDITNNRLVDSVPIPHEIASYKASFLNDLMVDNRNGFVYIADSGIFTDPLEGGLIVYNMRTKELRRVLHQHVSTQDEPDYWFKIAGKPVWQDRPMRTGADGIALSADRKTLYWCPLTGRHLYCIDTALLQDFNVPHAALAAAVATSATRGHQYRRHGRRQSGQHLLLHAGAPGHRHLRSPRRQFRSFMTDPRMVWVDGLTFDSHGYIIFNSNRLHELFGGELDWEIPYNLIVWRAFLGDGVKSYLYAA